MLPKLADPAMRRQFAAQLADYTLDLTHIRIAWVPSKENHHPAIGMSLAEFRRVARQAAGRRAVRTC